MRDAPCVAALLCNRCSQIDRPWLDEHSQFAFLLVMIFFPCFSRPHLGSVPDFRFPVEDGPTDSYSGSAVLRRPQKGRVAALRDEPSKARACPLQGHLLHSHLSAHGPGAAGNYSVHRSRSLFPPPTFLFLAESLLLRCAFFFKNGRSDKIGFFNHNTR